MEEEVFNSEEAVKVQIPADLHGTRLDAAAAHLFPDFSRSRLAEWIKAGGCSAITKWPNRRTKWRSMTSYRCGLKPTIASNGRLNPCPSILLYEDEHVIVLDKPAGLVVHPATGHQTGTLVNGLLAHAPEMSALPRGGIVHRLDKDTSGVMLAARSAIAHKSLVAQLADRSVSRIYSAVCRGTFTGGGTIDAPIGRHPTSRLKMAVVEDGKPSRTHYRIEKRFRAHTHLSVSLETGRTHQIRVHLAWRKHPLVGDPVYAGRAMRPAGASDQLAGRAGRLQATSAACPPADLPPPSVTRQYDL